MRVFDKLPMRLLDRLLSPFTANLGRERINQFESLPRPNVDVLFIGDSITQAAEWAEWLPEFSTANRGIGGDDTQGVLDRLDSLGRGRVVCILIGTNDLTRGVTAERVARNTRTLVSELRHRTPGAAIILQSVMPRSAPYAAAVIELNEHYRQIAGDLGVTFLDLWPTLSDDIGRLRAEFTRDNLHLNGRGYQAWVSALTPAIRDELAGGGRGGS